MDVGVIGAGTVGRNHARIYSGLKGVGTTYVYDIDDEVAAATGAVVCRSREDLLKCVDCVSIAVPTPHRAKIAREAIAAGVHTLIEKPPCLSSIECERLAKLIPDDLVVGIDLVERFNPVITEIRDLIDDPHYVAFHRHNPASPRVTGNSVVTDLMMHDIDIVSHALFPGETCTIHASGTGDVAAALATFGRTPVYLSASRRAAKKVRLIYVEVEDRTIIGDLMTQEITIYHRPETYGQSGGLYHQENVIENLLVNKVEPLMIELETFLQAVREGTPFPVTIEQGLANLRICEAIYRDLSA
ncbi:MAG: Gfo/Idh/MocA family oxidoreductase [Methanoculleus sp.]